MPKRRAVSGTSDDEGLSQESSPASKRARTDDSELKLEASQTGNRAKSRGRSRRRDESEDEHEDEDEDEDDVEQQAPDEDEERRFEEENEEKIRANVMSKGKTQGAIAEMGIIESLEMHQFMCHKYLTFTFGPQINFIIGHNGSGKSAVLSALTVALGGKATSTGRGNGLKSFIREGQGAAEVTVVLKNLGDEAYKPKEYGKSIVITRRFTKEGSSSYKIRSKDGRTISTKREELSAICDHMNIQVDNPMNILTQDSARQFLSASHPADKYKFFLRGTQLSQLSEEYQTCLENISQIQKVLERKSEAIPDLQEKLEEATARFQEANKAREQQHKVDELKKELAWAYVASKEKELQAKMGDVAKQKSRLDKIKKDLTEAERRFNETSKKVEAWDADLNGLGSIEHLEDEKKGLELQIRANRSDIVKLKEEEKHMNTNVTNLKTQIAKLEEKIAGERVKAESMTQGKRDENARLLEAAEAARQEAEQRLKAARTEQDQKKASHQDIGQRSEQLEKDRQTLQERIMQNQAQLQHCDQREKNKLAPFGRDIDRVLTDIERTNWHGSKPIGPFGLYVNVKDAERWAPLMRVQLGGLMSAFAVTDARDRMTLDAILKHHGNQNCSIIISEVDLFDYSRGEPPAGVPTVLRTLDITHDWVLRILINQAHIEQTVVAPTRSQADELLRSLGGGGVAWSADLYTVRRFTEGGGSSSPMTPLRPGDPRQQLFTTSNVAEAKRHWQEEVRKAEQEYEALGLQYKQLRQQHAQLTRELTNLTNEETRWQQIERDKATLKATLLLEQNDDSLQLIHNLEDHLKELMDEKDSIVAQFKVVDQRRAEKDAAQRPLVERLEQVKKQISEYAGERERLTRLMEDAAATRLTAQGNKQYYEKKLKDEEKLIADAEDVVMGVEEEFKEWTAKAEKFCARWPNPGKAEDLQRALEAVQLALREREKRHGASVEEMTVEVNKAKAALDNMQRELRNMAALQKALKKSVRIRLTKWHDFRRHIALRCKVYFSYHLSNRGYYGKVVFNHAQQTLQLKVQTDDQTSTQSSREKDPRSLSGGEKSFSTICLLLSLWESIGCPIRCLDEFDVFMDAVNRRISMKMMIDTANASDRKQYVLITPQDMTNIAIGNTVRVHRMTDPERGQGTLRFS